MVIARFYKIKWPASNHLVLEIQVLNFNRLPFDCGMRVARSLDCGLQISDWEICGFIVDEVDKVDLVD
jgi:hypothetical protein